MNKYPIQIETILSMISGLLCVSFRGEGDNYLGSMQIDPKEVTGSKFSLHKDDGEWFVYVDDLALLRFESVVKSAGFFLFGARNVWDGLQEIGFEVL